MEERRRIGLVRFSIAMDDMNRLLAQREAATDEYNADGSVETHHPQF
jgi:hypothetical protein